MYYYIIYLNRRKNTIDLKIQQLYNIYKMRQAVMFINFAIFGSDETVIFFNYFI